jgi:pilus assembly protein CpaD
MLVTGSCTPTLNDGSIVSDGAVNHPISVEPVYESIKISFSGPGAPLVPDDAARLEGFVQDYLNHGNGSISVSAPDGPGAQETIHYFGERLASMGVARPAILVGTHDVTNGDMRVEISYMGYVARTGPCANWTQNLGYTEDNLPSPDFGCSVQQNLAAMVADPRDLMGPRNMSDADATRRATVVGHYEKGEITSSEKRKGDLSNEQSGSSSDVGH